MSTKDVVFFDGDHPTPLDRVAQAFAGICGQMDAPAVNGRKIGHGLPGRPVSAGELVEVLPLLDQDGRDAVWRELIFLTRTRGEPWATIAAGIALPGLRTAAAMLTAGHRVDPEDLDAELVTAFYEALHAIDRCGPLVCARLRERAYNQARRIRYGTVGYAIRIIDTDEIPESAAPPEPWGHPDFVLADAVAAGVITRAEAGLIGASRLEGRALSAIAKVVGCSQPTAWRHREAAEKRLAEWIVGKDPQPGE
jgi:hypothetical protein